VSDIAEQNRADYRRARTVRSYDRSDPIDPMETRLFEGALRPWHGRPLLDLGVGGGRTAGPLSRLFPDYLGLDYAPEMVALCRRRFPGLAFTDGDARDLSRFEGASFGVVVFSYNGLDSMAHGDRLRVLAEVRRVLAPDGAFAFSAHNLCAPVVRAWHPANLPRSAHPLRLARGLARYAQGILHQIPRLRREERHADHAIRSDPTQNYRLLIYHIDQDAQRRQLAAAGFAHVRAFDRAGRELRRGERPGDPWLHYLATCQGAG
jgi:SAM-dependent methyltransferase